jgi:hypothetical protein
MEKTSPRCGRPKRSFPAKFVGFHLPEKALAQVELFTRKTGMSKTAFYQAATCLLLENFNLKKPEDVEVGIEELRNPFLAFNAEGELVLKEDLL